VRLSFEEIRPRAAQCVQAARRLRACLNDLLQIAVDERREPLERQLCLLDAAIDNNGVVSRESAVWQQSDPQGIGTSRAAVLTQTPSN
jgi:hypothetical protein